MNHQEVKSVEVVTYPDGRMDAKNTAAYLGLAVKTLAMMRCAGSGPRFVKRGRVFYFKDDVDAWMAGDGPVSSTAQARQRACA
jgi:hypothetical protein